MSEVQKVPAIGFSITANVDGNRQIVFQGYFEQDEDDKVVNARLDRVMALTDRQRAKYSMPDLKVARDKIERELAQYEQDVDTAELEFKKTQAALDVQIVELSGKRERLTNEGVALHNSQGKTGAYHPKGATQASLDNIEKALAEVRERKAANEAERQQFLDNISISIKRRQKELPLLQEQIADLERLFGG